MIKCVTEQFFRVYLLSAADADFGYYAPKRSHLFLPFGWYNLFTEYQTPFSA